MKITGVKFPKKPSFGPNDQFWLDYAPKFCKLMSQDPCKASFLNVGA